MKYLIALITLVFASCTPTIDDGNEYNIDESRVALRGYSPVSYVESSIAEMGTSAFKSEYDGINYFFTSSEQQDLFQANPDKYLPQFGGYCAFGISIGAKFRPAPNNFIVKNGKYYMFLKNPETDAKQLWMEGDHGKLVSKAQSNWKKLGARAD